MTKHKGSLINIFSENMFMFTGNPYVTRMFQEIDFELQKLINEKDSDDSDAYVLFDLYEYVLSAKNDPIWFATPEDPQFSEHVNRIFKNLPVEDNFNLKDSDYEKSWMLKRIKTLKIDFAQKLNEISETEKIPLSSIVRIYHIFLYGYYFYTKPTGKESPALSNIGISFIDKLDLLTKEKLLYDYFFYTKPTRKESPALSNIGISFIDMLDLLTKEELDEFIKKIYTELESTGQLSENKNDPPDEFWLINIPKDLSEKAQKDSVITVWEKIRNLFIENLYVFVFVGALETLVLNAYKLEGIEKTKEKLLLTAFNADMEKKIKAISSEDERDSFFKDNLYIFGECFIDLIISYSKFIKNAVKRKKLVESLGLYKKKLKENTNKDDPIEVETALKNKEKILFINLHFELSPQFLDFCEKKNGGLQEYELTGKPDNFRGYIYRILDNFLKTLSKLSFNEFLVKEFGISLSTFKRYEINFQIGKYDHLFNNFGQKPESLYEIVNDDKYKEFFYMINFEEEKRRAHFKDGFLTQKDLILDLLGKRTVFFKEIEFKSTEEGDHNVFMLVEYFNDLIDCKSLYNIFDVDNSSSNIDDDGNSSSNIDDDGNSSRNIDGLFDKSNTRSAQIQICIDLLKDLLEMPDLYDKLIVKMPKLSQFMTDLVEKTKPLRQKNYNDLLENEQNLLSSFNRRLIEEVYPSSTPKRQDDYSKEYDFIFEQYSISTYKDILKILREQNKIQWESEKGNIYYKSVDRHMIAKEISEYIKTRKLKKISQKLK